MDLKTSLNKLKHSSGPLFGAALFLTALMVLRNQLHHYHYHQIVTEIEAIPVTKIGIALLFTILNYAVLSLYEIAGFKYIRNKLSSAKIAFTSFIAFAFSNNIGFYSLSGGAVRFRLYSSWGLSNFEITKLITFSSGLAFWLGLSTICGITFILEPIPLPLFLNLPHIPFQIVGALFLLVPVSFCIFTMIRKAPLKIFNWEFEIPSLSLSLSLMGTVCLDWIFFSSVLYTLLPVQHLMTFPHFLSLFLAAQLVGLVSHVPGGLGVFETVLLSLLPTEIERPVALGAILTFRAIYYFLPLAVSSLLLVLHELKNRRAAFKGVSRNAIEWANGVIPPVFALLVFLGGIILLSSGATPAVEHRLHLLKHFIPLPFVELSHFLASVAGVILLIISWGIYKRFDSAYYLSLYTLGAGILFSIIKGFDYEEAAILLVAFIILLPCHRFFYRKTSFLSGQFSTGWTLGILSVIAGTIWLGFFSYKHTSYASELWWQFSFNGNASRFLRASAGSAVVMIFFGVLHFFKGAQPPQIKVEPVDILRASKIVNQSPLTYAHLALLGDKKFLWHDDGQGFIMYGVRKQSWISMGDPIGPPEMFMQLIWKFKELADGHAGRAVFYEVRREYLHMYIDIGLSFMKLGECARVRCADFTLDGGSKKSLRHTIHKIEDDGWSFEVIPSEGTRVLIPNLKEISDSWLEHKNTREKRFSLGNFNEEYLCSQPVAIVKRADSIVAFANMWVSDTMEEVSIDMMRYVSDAPKGIMDYMFTKLLLWSREQHFTWFDLGMAPFSGLENHPLAPVWSKLGSFLYSNGENFYNFRGLRQFKEKFDPVWEPRYLASPGGLSLPIVLGDAAALISGDMRGIIGK
jgi:phosphatidylglycerol lysyltransferase